MNGKQHLFTKAVPEIHLCLHLKRNVCMGLMSCFTCTLSWICTVPNSRVPRIYFLSTTGKISHFSTIKEFGLRQLTVCRLLILLTNILISSGIIFNLEIDWTLALDVSLEVNCRTEYIWEEKSTQFGKYLVVQLNLSYRFWRPSTGISALIMFIFSWSHCSHNVRKAKDNTRGNPIVMVLYKAVKPIE